ncbi:hypothetical protein PR202_ga17864 [Eleusine coracana subsp. coracana]|uniref:Uncharacterized protein n=1 Tax=Eleusine coracana subsp. coracana TaxID=191504 RepID=A0AAV5CRK0_ELECO|nr:hypothetical protein QOZ80_6AG0512280 [Eleusine coracana subsp. coracana]GJN00668.1 hypothetical protein PR202_ga17864 [Eleusine coracana subsp. coracana]
MDVLEHPLEAVAFRLYSLQDASAASGAAAWTCLAAVLAAAAAAGLWRLRSSTPASGTEALKSLELEAYKAKQEVSLETARSSARSSPDSAASTAPSPKERYTAYYYRDSVRVGCCDVDDEEGDEVEEEEAEEQDEDDDGVYPTSGSTTGPFGWDQEVVRSLPLSPTAVEVGGRYRSPTAALGSRSSSVVRLWDEAIDAGVTASPRRRSRVVGPVAAF